MNGLLQDLKYGLRMLARSPGFTAVAVITLALGIGANTAIFSAVHAVLLSSLPYRQPERLVKVWGQLTRHGIPRNWFSDPEWFELVDTNQAFEQVAAYYPNYGANLTSADAAPRRVTLGYATASLFPLLGVQPILGRMFSEGEDQPGHDEVAVLSYGLWKSLYGGEPNVLGRTIRLNDHAYTVIGVLPEGFDFEGDNQAWTPLALDRKHPGGRGSHSWTVIARLKSGVSFAQASADMNRFAAQLAREYPDYYTGDSGWGVYIVPLREELIRQIRPALLILTGAVGFVLLIACANIANLLLARAAAREKEMAIRASLGAGKARVVRQLLTESVLLSLVGGAVGLVFSSWGMSTIRGLGPEALPHIGTIGLDPAVLLFTLAVAVLTGILLGLAPALYVSSSNLRDTLKEGGRSSLGGPGGRRLRSALVVSEMAFALILLIGAGLMIRSFARLLQVNPGFNTEHLLTMRVTVPKTSYPDGPRVWTFFRQVLDKIRPLPGVESAGAISVLPMGGDYSSGSVLVEDSTAQVLQHAPGFFQPYGYLETDRRYITPGYIEAMKTPLVAGRLLTDADTADSQPVALVDTEFAQHVWPGKNPLGRRIAFASVPNSSPPQPQWCTVVGVVMHVHNYSLEVQGREQGYFPQTQVSFARSMFLVVRTAQDPAPMANSIREQVASVDKNQPIYAVRTMEDLVSTSVEQPRLSLALLGIFAGLAAVLAGIGICGVMAYRVSQRSHEIGIRMALGAEPGDVLKLVLGQGMALTVVGIGLGLAGAWVLTRFLSSLLYGVQPTDPLTFAGVSLLLVGVAMLACYIPARRATKIDPMEALRYE
jgi:predicted permease